VSEIVLRFPRIGVRGTGRALTSSTVLDCQPSEPPFTLHPERQAECAVSRWFIFNILTFLVSLGYNRGAYSLQYTLGSP
jgi:hypothetical protein